MAFDGVLDIPVEGVNQFVTIRGMVPEDYEGLVYSLDVEKDHTYIADGLVVGNSIYGFAGAVPDLLKQYSEKWRDVEPSLYRIARNHRSVPEIVDFANLIQQKMTRTIPLKMESWRGMQDEHGYVRKLTSGYPTSVAALIAQEIQRDSRRVPFKENALLVRAGLQIRDLETELIKRRIPYVVRGGYGLLTSEEIRDIMAYMRLAANHKDFTSLCRAAGAPRCGVGEVGLEKLRALANDEHEGDLVRAARASVKKLSLLCDVIEHASMFKDNPVAVVEKIVAMTGYKDYIRQKYKKEPGKVEGKLENIERFATMVIVLAQEGSPTLDDLIFNLTMERPKGAGGEEKAAVLKAFEQGKIDEAERDAKLQVIEQGAVTITTIHSAKGLEWKRVYVTNVVEGSLPHMFSVGSEEEIEEERRLFYVACTRARDSLIVCVPEKQVKWTKDGQQKEQRLFPSRFLLEIGA
jgi:DNA helicase-2/ATP-dependent DNA helicase PcrA